MYKLESAMETVSDLLVAAGCAFNHTAADLGPLQCQARNKLHSSMDLKIVDQPRASADELLVVCRPASPCQGPHRCTTNPADGTPAHPIWQQLVIQVPSAYPQQPPALHFTSGRCFASCCQVSSFLTFPQIRLAGLPSKLDM